MIETIVYHDIESYKRAIRPILDEFQSCGRIIWQSAYSSQPLGFKKIRELAEEQGHSNEVDDFLDEYLRFVETDMKGHGLKITYRDEAIQRDRFSYTLEELDDVKRLLEPNFRVGYMRQYYIDHPILTYFASEDPQDIASKLYEYCEGKPELAKQLTEQLNDFYNELRKFGNRVYLLQFAQDTHKEYADKIELAWYDYLEMIENC